VSAIDVRALAKGDPPPFDGLVPSAHLVGEHVSMLVLEGGMASGKPSVTMHVLNPDGTVVLIEFGLEALYAATRTARVMAAVRGWLPEPTP
jgi:hypothetical protein